MSPQIEALKRKDRDAWRDVYEELVDAVYQHALYRLNGDRHTAEDVTQEVFVRAIESIGSFRGDGTGLLQWLRGISRRVIARRMRDLRPTAARALSLDQDQDEGSFAAAPDPVDQRPQADEQLASKEGQLLTGAALTALPPQWERVLRWKYCENLSVAEIANRLGISQKAAESLLSRARAGFRASYLRFLERGKDRVHEVEETSDD